LDLVLGEHYPGLDQSATATIDQQPRSDQQHWTGCVTSADVPTSALIHRQSTLFRVTIDVTWVRHRRVSRPGLLQQGATEAEVLALAQQTAVEAHSESHSIEEDLFDGVSPARWTAMLDQRTRQTKRQQWTVGAPGWPRRGIDVSHM
jgi:hypothetical protein